MASNSSEISTAASVLREIDYFEMLPVELLVRVMSYLHAKDVGEMAKLNQRLNSITKTKTVNRHINLSQCRNSSVEWLTDFLRERASLAETLDLSHNYWIPTKALAKLAPALVNLTSLDVTDCCISQECLLDILGHTVELRSLAFTWWEGYHFSYLPTAVVKIKAAQRTLEGLRKLKVVKAGKSCFDLCRALIVHCRNLKSLTTDDHLTGNCRSCLCTNLLDNEEDLNEWSIDKGNLHQLEVLFCSGTSTNCTMCVNFMSTVLQDLWIKEDFWDGVTQLIISPKLDFEVNKMFEKHHAGNRFAPNLVSLNISDSMYGTFFFENVYPSLRYFRLESYKVSTSQVDFFSRLMPNLQFLVLHEYEFVHYYSGNKKQYLSAEFMDTLGDECTNLQGLALQGVHIHYSPLYCPITLALSKLAKLKHLCISPCALESHDEPSIFDTDDDRTERSQSSNNDSPQEEYGISRLVEACPYLTELELIDPGICITDLSREGNPLQSVDWKYGEQERSISPKDSGLHHLGRLEYLTRLTLGGLSGIRDGSGFHAIMKGCQQLSFLSLADVGLRGQCTWLPAFCSSLKNAHALQDLRIEHESWAIPSILFKSLQSCKELRRLCLISRRGKISEPSMLGGVFESCPKLWLMVVLTADSTSTKKRLTTHLTKKYKKTRVPLCVLFRFFLHGFTSKNRENMCKSIQDIDVREIVVFASHVSSPQRYADVR